ncbi:hypothetical protein HPB52_010167 [Rhipicephalus sanguineus]|uniref:Uncharacterized protein n=1 Tax=Rhipicephalus sanguineus TaxID=34632 RepID=A0A9D4YMW5_RHISA|nr:hypothetical protein HPB52_010167 [Rhipicephalus sanguineus]
MQLVSALLVPLRPRLYSWSGYSLFIAVTAAAGIGSCYLVLGSGSYAYVPATVTGNEARVAQRRKPWGERFSRPGRRSLAGIAAGLAPRSFSPPLCPVALPSLVGRQVASSLETGFIGATGELGLGPVVRSVPESAAATSFGASPRGGPPGRASERRPLGPSARGGAAAERSGPGRRARALPRGQRRLLALQRNNGSLAGPGCSAPPAEGNGNDERAQGRSPSSPPVECATALRFPADNFPTITTTTAEPGDGARFPAAGAGGPRAALKRKLPDAPSPPTLAASTLTDLITRGIDKFVELEHKRMRLELDLLERLRHEELERLERMRREEMDHELRLMSVLASLFNNNNSTSSVNLNSSSSEPPAGS